MIEIEQRNTGDIWKNQFTSQYLEEITAKTGNFKKYPVFLKMLLSSFAKQSDSVFIDVLTYWVLINLQIPGPRVIKATQELNISHGVI
jgi:coiled-coil domain-containing protein 61